MTNEILLHVISFLWCIVVSSKNEFSPNPALSRYQFLILYLVSFSSVYEIRVIFWVPPFISGTGKAMNFIFCTYIHRVEHKKKPVKFVGKVTMTIVRDHRNFSGHQYIGVSRGHHCDSTAFLLQGVYYSWKSLTSPGILLMLLENLIVSHSMITCQ